MGLALVLGLAFAASAQAQTKIAVINVGEVFQKYDKAKQYKAELEKVLEPKKAEAETLKKQIMDWKKALETPDFVKKEDRSKYEQAMLANVRKIEDIDRQLKPQIAKLQETQIVSLYRDLCSAVEGVAKANNIHLVLAYGDVTEDRFNIFNINRLMNGMDLGSTTPIFFDPSVNITQQVADTLNHHHRAAGGTTGVPATPVSRPGM